MRTDSPVWEQGFTFLVANPDNDTLQLKITDQKTGNEIGRLTYILSALLDRPTLEILSQPFQLQKSGPESKIVMCLSLRILKRVPEVEDVPEIIADVKEGKEQKHEESNSKEALKKQDSRLSNSSSKDVENSIEESVKAPSVSSSLAASPTSEKSALIRNPSIRSLSDPGALGALQMTLQYLAPRQRLVVIIHQIKNIPMKDPSNIPDPYVKLYLLPSRSKDSKRKTVTIKGKC